MTEGTLGSWSLLPAAGLSLVLINTAKSCINRVFYIEVQCCVRDSCFLWALQHRHCLLGKGSTQGLGLLPSLCL